MHQPIGTPPVCVEVIITAANEEWLAYLAHTLINDRIVARGHTTAPVRAIYRREDEICEEMQSRIGLHTRASLVSEIVERVDRDHPDDVRQRNRKFDFVGQDDALRSAAAADVRPSGLSGGNTRRQPTEDAVMEVLPRDITTLPHVLGSELIEYLTTTSAGISAEPDDWDPFAEAAGVIDPSLWYTTSFDATPERSITRWLPPGGSGLATVAVCSHASETAVLIRYGSRGPSNASDR